MKNRYRFRGVVFSASAGWKKKRFVVFPERDFHGVRPRIEGGADGIRFFGKRKSASFWVKGEEESEAGFVGSVQEVNPPGASGFRVF